MKRISRTKLCHSTEEAKTSLEFLGKITSLLELCGIPHLAFSEPALKPRRPQHTKQQQQRITGPVRIRAEFSQTRFSVPSCICWAGCGFQNSVPLAGNDSRTTSTSLSDKDAAKSETFVFGIWKRFEEKLWRWRLLTLARGRQPMGKSLSFC